MVSSVLSAPLSSSGTHRIWPDRRHSLTARLILHMTLSRSQSSQSNRGPGKITQNSNLSPREAASSPVYWSEYRLVGSGKQMEDNVGRWWDCEAHVMLSGTKLQLTISFLESRWESLIRVGPCEE